jgi:hypothetical protein
MNLIIPMREDNNTGNLCRACCMLRSIQESEIGRQLRDGGAVVRLNLLQFAIIAARDKIDAAALAPQRPERPMRCKYVCTSRGMSKLITVLTC